MVIIRLARGGAKKRPFYHLVVSDSRKRRDSSIECVGYFNPVARGQEIRLHVEMEKVAQWQKVGAQLSDRVKALVKEYSKAKAA